MRQVKVLLKEKIIVMKEPVNKSNVFTLVMFLVVFAAPILLALFIYAVKPDFLTSRPTTNYGTLVIPAVDMKSTGLISLKTGKPVRKRFFRGKWQFVYLDRSVCDKICERNLDNQRRIELATGRDSIRIKRVFILIDTTNKKRIKQLQAKFKNVTFVYAGQARAAQLIRLFAAKAGDQVVSEQRIYLVDPKGRLMMRYKPDKTEQKFGKQHIILLKGIERDLKHLLKNSSIG